MGTSSYIYIGAYLRFDKNATVDTDNRYMGCQKCNAPRDGKFCHACGKENTLLGKVKKKKIINSYEIGNVFTEENTENYQDFDDQLHEDFLLIEGMGPYLVPNDNDDQIGKVYDADDLDCVPINAQVINAVCAYRRKYQNYIDKIEQLGYSVEIEYGVVGFSF